MPTVRGSLFLFGGFGILLTLLLFGSQNVVGQETVSAPKPPHKRHQKKTLETSPETFTLVGAGDISWCKDLAGAQATAKLIEQIPGTVFAAGDLAYQNGSDQEFRDCYGPTWGRFKDRTYPTPGNHEYDAGPAGGYFRYWGARAGEPGKGYYSFDLGAWHIVALNTNCNAKSLGGCGKDSPEEAWLREDLAAHPAACILAFGHHALFSSGISPHHAIHPELRQFWRDLYEAHADVILAGHEHSYERFAPQDPDGHPDPDHGIREIVAGTGGKDHTLLGLAQPNSEERNDNTFGVLKLTLSPERYTWEFIPEPGKSFRDSGSGLCHNHPVPKP